MCAPGIVLGVEYTRENKVRQPLLSQRLVKETEVKQIVTDELIVANGSGSRLREGVSGSDA